jgi:hypothetical protein
MTRLGHRAEGRALRVRRARPAGRSGGNATARCRQRFLWFPYSSGRPLRGPPSFCQMRSRACCGMRGNIAYGVRHGAGRAIALRMSLGSRAPPADRQSLPAGRRVRGQCAVAGPSVRRVSGGSVRFVKSLSCLPPSVPAATAAAFLRGGDCSFGGGLHRLRPQRSGGVLALAAIKPPKVR